MVLYRFSFYWSLCHSFIDCIFYLSKDAVLQIFLEATSGTLNDESEMHIRNLYLLVIQCIEVIDRRISYNLN